MEENGKTMLWKIVTVCCKNQVICIILQAKDVVVTQKLFCFQAVTAGYGLASLHGWLLLLKLA